MATLAERAQALYPNMPMGFISLFIEKWNETGNADQAIGLVRKDPTYADYFPGNLTPTGQVRYSEVVFEAVKDAYIGTLTEFGLAKETAETLLGFQSTPDGPTRLTNLIEGDVSPREFAQRVGGVYEGIQENITQVQTYYRENFGMDLSTDSIFLGALDPAVGEEIIQGRITTAQIGGEAARAGFQDITLETVKSLQRAGVTQAQARQFFAAASEQIPRIQELQTREGATPDDVFDLDKFTEAMIFQSPDEAEEIRKLEAEEASRFSVIGGAARQGSRVTGLTEQ